MPDDDKLLETIEHAAVRGWPALESKGVSGWLWRFTSGGSIRANSTATVAFDGDLNKAIGAIEALYQARGSPSVFTISPLSCPIGLDDALAERGYVRGNDHITMAMSLDGVPAASPDGISLRSTPSSDWMEVYLSGLSPDRRNVAPRLIANLPPTAQFVTAQIGGFAASSGLTVVDRPVASVQCMATLPASRRQGGARRVLEAIADYARAAGCTHLYLQTGGDNTAAQALYHRFGFTGVGTYHTRTKILS